MEKWLAELDEKMPINGKKSYLTKERSAWIVIDETGKERYRGTRKNWAIAWIRKYWDNIN